MAGEASAQVTPNVRFPPIADIAVRFRSLGFLPSRGHCKQLAHWKLDNTHKPEHEHDDYDSDHQTKDAAHNRLLWMCSTMQQTTSRAGPGSVTAALHVLF